ncbi:hypothetical protein [Thalassobaculum sp.]|uniref:hypothetical protein n=1 Tax=Thalassobaculum sp. TaxID=2022740 RepID=UPI0032EF299C
MSLPDYELPEGRRFLNLPRDTPSARFGPLAGFVEIWRGKWRGDRLPAWSDFDFYDFVGWHGLIYVDQILARRPLEMRCRLWGSRLADLLGHDETGQLFSRSPAAGEPGLRAANAQLIDTGGIGIVLGRALSYGRMTEFTVVKLPCAEDGATVDHLIGCSQPNFTLAIDGIR